MIVTLLLSFISTFNTFGLIYLMTGGGPGGATRLYSILAYEKAIISLRFGPGAAVAFSMAPLLFLLIFVLARIMRRDEGVTGSEKVSLVDRVLGRAGRWLGVIIDLILLPFEWLSQALGSLFKLFVPRDQRRPAATQTLAA